jgi:hypothetical protein
MVTKPIRRELVTLPHKGSYWGPQAMCDVHLGIYKVAEQVCESCEGLQHGSIIFLGSLPLQKW